MNMPPHDYQIQRLFFAEIAEKVLLEYPSAKVLCESALEMGMGWSNSYETHGFDLQCSIEIECEEFKEYGYPARIQMLFHMDKISLSLFSARLLHMPLSDPDCIPQKFSDKILEEMKIARACAVRTISYYASIGPSTL